MTIWSAMNIELIQNMSQAPSKCLSEMLDFKKMFFLGPYKFLAMLDDKIRKDPFF